jgi:hypothetical protein
MKRDSDFTDDSKLVAVRLPKLLKARAKQHCQREDLTLSQLLRRAVRRELALPVGTGEESE